MKYRKKPLVYECWHYETLDDAPGWVYESVSEPNFVGSVSVFVRVGDESVILRPGDWLVKGIESEIYPVKDSVFRESYEKCDD